ncbi:MAG: A24 family peptidase [Bdellovibrionales bacterium]
MVLLVFYSLCLLSVLGLGAAAAVSDVRGMTIPNLYSVLVFAVFIVCFAGLSVFGYADMFGVALSHGLSFVCVFVAGFALYMLRVWGAGDQKLISGFAVWFAFSDVPMFVFYVIVFGGALGVVSLVIRRFGLFPRAVAGGWIAKLHAGEGKVPYGVAIALGALFAFIKAGYFDAGVFAGFLDSE